MKYFGYKLVVLSTLKGLPLAYDLVSANTDERLAKAAFVWEDSYTKRAVLKAFFK
jgi:ATP phosphoribosyltransferase regulatory subunit HisZ